MNDHCTPITTPDPRGTTTPDLHENARRYYGETLTTSADLKTSACCTDSIPSAHKPLLANIADEILTRFYGCGSPIPEALEGMTVLDLGCGTGRDAYLAAQLVGPGGTVIGVDMTEGQLAVARRHEETQRERFGYAAKNTDFRLGQIEDLAACGIADGSIDVVISNCVLNLAPDKEPVFREIWRVLKPGGELYFADVFARRRVPQHLRTHPELHGECLGGALYLEDFRRIMMDVGFLDFRTVESRAMTLDDPALARLVGGIPFLSATVRAFKLPGALEDRCEDYGQVATYLGTLPERPHAFTLDDHHVLETHRPERVCGNTAAMFANTRFAPHFRVDGDRSRHFGLFDGCAPTVATTAVADNGPACC